MSKYPGRIVTDLAPAGYSVSFDGTGDYIQAPSNTAFTMGTGAFTLEAWVYPNGSMVSGAFFIGGTTNGDFQFGHFTGNTFGLATFGIAWLITSTATLNLNAWNHCVFVRSGTGTNQASLFLNGVRVANGTVSQNFSNTQIARLGDALNGYISNARVVKGTAVYDPTATTINVPTQLFNITNTSLLTCNSPAIVDQSTNNFTITANGNAAVSTLTPFTAYVPYNPSSGAATPGVWTLDEAMQARQTRRWNMYDPHFNYTTVLLRSSSVDGSQNNTFLDSSNNAFPITRNGGNPGMTQGTFSPFSHTGWGIFLNGSSTFAAPAGLQTAFAGWGGRTRTWECWIYRDSTTSYNLQSAYNAVAANGRWYILISASNKLTFGWTTSTSTQTEVNSVTTIPTGWVHLSVSVNSTTSTSTTVYLGINGVVETFTGNNLSTQTSTYGWNDIFGNAIYLPAIFTGAFTGLRWSNNLRYTSNYTVPTGPFVNDANTLFLFGQQNRFSDESSNAYAVTVAAGIPSTQAFSPFYPSVSYDPLAVGGSGYFDGTGDYLNGINNQAALQFGTGDFTVECWVYPVGSNTYSAEKGFLQISTTAGGLSSTYTSGLFLAFRSNTGVYYSINGATTGVVGGATTLNNWVHIAITRQSGTVRGWMNGQQVITYPDSVNLTANNLAIGGYFSTAYLLDGYLSNVRIVKGVAVYTGTFTPPIAPLSTSGAASASAYPSTTNVNTSFAASATSVLCNFTNAAIRDAAAKAAFETVGNAQASTSVRNTQLATTPPTSIYFDGSGDGLQSLGGHPLLWLGSGDYTVEAWVRVTAVNLAEQTIIAYGTSGGNFRFQINNADIRILNGPNLVASGATSAVANTWMHIAAVRFGTGTNNTKIYLNGLQIAQASNTTDFSSGTLTVGQDGGRHLNGYIDDLRITRGIARYTGPFTPPRSRLQEQ